MLTPETYNAFVAAVVAQNYELARVIIDNSGHHLYCWHELQQMVHRIPATTSDKLYHAFDHYPFTNGYTEEDEYGFNNIYCRAGSRCPATDDAFYMQPWPT